MFMFIFFCICDPVAFDFHIQNESDITKFDDRHPKQGAEIIWIDAFPIEPNGKIMIFFFLEMFANCISQFELIN